MKLSEAMREGAKKRPQVFGDYFDFTLDGSQVGSCAVGAALEAMTGKAYVSWGSENAMRELGVLEGRRRWPLEDIIAFLNDEWRWSRERIADLLERHGY